MHKFIPSCVPWLSRPIPWWNRHCEMAWQKKMNVWHSIDGHKFHKASLYAAHVYSAAFQSYQAHLYHVFTHFRNCVLF